MIIKLLFAENKKSAKRKVEYEKVYRVDPGHVDGT